MTDDIVTAARLQAARNVIVVLHGRADRLEAENGQLRDQIDVLKIELAQARTGRALLEVERLEAENRELRERLAAGFASTVVIDVSHDDAARKLRQVMRALETIPGPDGGMQ